MSKNKNKKYTIGSLFAGIGGICLGFKKAGFSVKWANDIDKHACVTYRANFDNNPSIIRDDVRELTPESLGRVDVITAGFPCQAFSIAGYRNGFKDPRGNLFFEIIRFIDKLKPKAILLENVKHLITHDGKNTIRVIEDYIRHSGYSFIPKILNSMEYGNVPQNRERICIVGFRGEEGFHGNQDRKNICSSVFKFPKPVTLIKKIQDLLEEGEVDEKYYYASSKYYEEFKKHEWCRNTVYQWRRIYLRKNKSNVCPTLTANMGTGGHNVPLVKDKHDIRKLTPRECARLQGFEDDFVLPEGMANSHLYKQIGNSVTVPVIRRIAEQIKAALDAKYNCSKKKRPASKMEAEVHSYWR